MTTSRRTPVWAENLLKDVFARRSFCPLLLIANESNRPGVVGGILGLSDRLVVTAESMSMVAEAVSTGKPVLVVRVWHDQKMKRKYEDYLNSLEKEKRIVLCEAGEVRSQLEKWMNGDWMTGESYRLREETVLGHAVRRIL
jgi:hypothetical protein